MKYPTSKSSHSSFLDPTNVLKPLSQSDPPLSFIGLSSTTFDSRVWSSPLRYIDQSVELVIVLSDM